MFQQLKKPHKLVIILALFSMGLAWTTKSDANSEEETIEQQRESLWQTLLKQRQELENESKKNQTPLREVLSKEDFVKKFPLLPHGRQLDSLPSLHHTELRIATIPKNVNRENKPYSIVAIAYKSKSKEIEIKIVPDTPTARRILNLSNDWDFAEKVTDFPNIIAK